MESCSLVIFKRNGAHFEFYITDWILKYWIRLQFQSYYTSFNFSHINHFHHFYNSLSLSHSRSVSLRHTFLYSHALFNSRTERSHSYSLLQLFIELSPQLSHIRYVLMALLFTLFCWHHFISIISSLVCENTISRCVVFYFCLFIIN